MRRSLASLTILVLSTPVALSQSTVTLSPGVELSIPVRDFADEAGTGFGISGRVQFSPSTGLGLMGTVGYLWWGSKSTVDATSSYEALQTMGGLKLYVLKGVYALAEAGAYFMTSTSSLTWIETTASQTDARLMFSAGAGGEIGSIEFEAKYSGSQYTREHTASVRIGYRFGL